MTVKGGRSFEIDYSQGLLGGGEFSRVYRGRLGGTQVAVKVINKERGCTMDVDFLRSLNHKNIVQTLDVVFDHFEVYIVTEFCDHGSLFDVLASPERVISKPDVCRWALQLAAALSYLHELRVVHRDIKPSNVVLDADDNAKLCDFGMACRLDDLQTLSSQFYGTCRYVAPEIMLLKLGGGAGSDIWSFGLVVLDLVIGLQSKFWYARIRDPTVVRPVELFSALPPALADVLWNCLSQNPAARPTCRELLTWLTAASEQIEHLSEDQWHELTRQCRREVMRFAAVK